MYRSILFDPPGMIPPPAGGVGPAGFVWVAPPSKSSTGGKGPGGVKLSVMSAAAVAAAAAAATRRGQLVSRETGP